MTRILSPEEFLPTPVEQQVEPAVETQGQSAIIDADPNVTRPGLRAALAQRFRGGVEEQTVAPASTDETTVVPAQRDNKQSLFNPRIMTFEETSDASADILSITPVSGTTQIVVTQPRIATFEDVQEAPANPVVEEAATPAFTAVETDADNSATAIPGMVAVAQPVRRQKERPARAKASVRKRERKAAVAAAQAVAPTAAPVAESKPATGRKEAQKVSFIGGLALAKLTGGRSVIRKPNVKLPRRNKSAAQAEPVEVALAAPKEKFSVSKKLNDVQNELYFGTKNRIARLNKSELNEKLYQRKGMLASAIGAIAVVGIAYAAHKGFDINFGEQGAAAAAPNADGGVAQAAAEQATAPQIANEGVTPKGGGAATAPIGSAEAAEIASAAAPAPELKGASEALITSGAGFTDLIQDSANQLGVELSGQEAYDLYESLETQFGGDIITGETYQMDDGNYGISNPGKTSWNPDAQRFFEEQLEELKKKKLAS